jgi:hypothetical protein
VRFIEKRKASLLACFLFSGWGTGIQNPDLACGELGKATPKNRKARLTAALHRASPPSISANAKRTPEGVLCGVFGDRFG